MGRRFEPYLGSKTGVLPVFVFGEARTPPLQADTSLKMPTGHFLSGRFGSSPTWGAESQQMLALFFSGRVKYRRLVCDMQFIRFHYNPDLFPAVNPDYQGLCESYMSQVTVFKDRLHG